MLNILARAHVSKALEPLGSSLARMGVNPNAVTVVGTTGAVVSALVCFSYGRFFVGTLLVWGFVMLDMVDGAVARAGGKGSKFGALLDSTSDRVADAAVFASIAWYYAFHDRQPWLVAGTLLCLVLGSLTSYIRARAEGLGFHATVGFAERTERLIIILVGTGLTGKPFDLPYVQNVAIWGLVVASAITVGQRIAAVLKQSQAEQRAAAAGAQSGVA